MRYRIVKQIMESGSFTKAAEKLNMTQSAVSHAVGTFENELGFPIFIRNKSGVGLTSEGEALRPYIETLVITEDRLFNEANAINAVEAGTLRVGSFATASSRILPQIMKVYDERYPNIKVELIDSDYEIIKEKLEDGSIDIAVLEEKYIDKDYYKLPYLYDELMVVVPNLPAFQGLKSMPIGGIPSYPFIMPDNDQDTFLKQMLKKYDVSPNIKYRFQLLSTVFAMIEVGLGITIVSETALKTYKFDVLMIPLEPKLYRNVSLVALRPQMSAPVVKAFFDVAKLLKVYY